MDASGVPARPLSATLLPKDSTFGFCFASLREPIRERAVAAYQLLRLADDTADRTMDEDSRLSDLLQIQKAYYRVPGYSLPNPRLVEVLDGYLDRLIPELDLVIEGMQWDLMAKKYDTVDDLYQYCDRVSNRATRVFVHLFDDDPDDWWDYIYATGLALQLTNILRDIEGDATQGRNYLPEEWLKTPEPDIPPWRRLALLAYANNVEASRLFPARASASMIFVESCRRSYEHLLGGVWSARENGTEVPRKVPPPLLENIPCLVEEMVAKGRPEE